MARELAVEMALTGVLCAGLLIGAVAAPGAVDEELFEVVVRVVHDDTGKPVEDALVEVWHDQVPRPGFWERTFGDARLRHVMEPSDPTGFAPDATHRTGADGRCRFEAPDGSVVCASKPGVGTSGRWVPGHKWSVHSLTRLREADTRSRWEATLPLRAQARIQGTVLEPSGAPAVGAVIEFSVGGFRLARELTLARAPPLQRTDGDGAFALLVDAPVEGSVWAERDGVRSPGVGFELEPDGEASMELPLRGAYQVRGRVVGAGVGRFVGLDVQLSGARENLTQSVDLDGGFEFALAYPGQVRVKLQPREGRVQAAPVVVTLDDEQSTAEVTLGYVDGASIRGFVRWDDGTPAGRATVHGSPQTDRVPLEIPVLSEEIWASTSTDDDGAFELFPVHPDYTYRVQTSERARDVAVTVTRTDVEPGGSVELVLERARIGGVRIQGVVVDGATGEPVPHYQLTFGRWYGTLIEATASLGGGQQTIDDPEGRFDLTGLRHQLAALRLEAPGYPSRLVGPVGSVGPVGTEGLELPPLRIALERGGALDVHVVDETGEVVDGAALRLYAPLSAESPDLFDPRPEVATDAAGACGWSGLVPGRHAVQAAAGDRLSDVVFVDVEPETTTKATIVVREDLLPGSLEVECRDELGRAQTAEVHWGLREVVGPPAGPEHDHALLVDGRVTFEGLRPGHYRIQPRMQRGMGCGHTSRLIVSGEETLVRFQRE